VSQTTPATAADGSGGTTTYTYDPAGNLLTTTDPGGVTTTYTYNAAGKKAIVAYSGSTAHTVTYTYDANGNRTAMTDASGTSSYTYDPFGRLTSVTNGNNQTVSYSYDGDGDITGITYPLLSTASWATSSTVSHTYDKADRMTSATDFAGNEMIITDNADGSQASEALGSSGDSITTGYDNTGAVSTITLDNSPGTTLQSFSYSDASDGSVLIETDSPVGSGTSKAYTYTSQGQLASETNTSNDSYGYDDSGNLTGLPGNASGAYDNDGELVSSTSSSGIVTSYTYNADGERTAATTSGSVVASATWNGAEELTAYTDGAGAMTSATYDGDGLRVSSTMTSGGTQDYTWNPLSTVPQLLADSANAYIYTAGGAPAEQVNLSTGTVTYLVTDLLGSVRGTVNSGGSLTGTTAYDAWGNPLTSGGLTATTPFGYAGSYTDATGLVYLLNRYYDPVTGQFTSVDPLVDTTGQPYAYADGNPVIVTDPDGRSGCTEGTWGGFREGPTQDWQGQLEQCVDGTGLFIRWRTADFLMLWGRICGWHYDFRAYWGGKLRKQWEEPTHTSCSQENNLSQNTKWTTHYTFPTSGTFDTFLWATNNIDQLYLVTLASIYVHP
jgi:RHS repeat-associated protein